jgi:hypothetical protein
MYAHRQRRFTEALRSLQDAHYRLTLQVPGHPLAPTKPLSLHTSIVSSIQMLSSSARKTLQALSRLPPKLRTFFENDALVLSGGSLGDLDALCDVGLLEAVGEERYHLHQVIADDARLMLSASSILAE